MNFTDQQLSAYLDGELSDDEARALEAALQNDPALREALSRLQSVDNVLSEVLGDIAEEPVAEHIRALAQKATPEAAPDAASQARSRQVISLARWKSGLSRLTLPVGLAASLMVGFIVGGQLLPGLNTPVETGMMAGVVDERSDLYAVLEYVPSGTTQNGLSPALSFTTTSGVCREVSAETQRALACREDTVWTVLVVSHDSSLRGGRGYQTASGETSIIFDILADQLMEGPPLSAEDEALLIENHWRDPAQSTDD